MLIGILHVDLPHAPRLIFRSENDLSAEFFDSTTVIVPVVHKNREPRARMTLPAKAEEDFHLSEPNCAKGRRFSPIPKLLEQQFSGVILHRLREVADIQDWRQTLGGDFRVLAHKSGPITETS